MGRAFVWLLSIAAVSLAAGCDEPRQIVASAEPTSGASASSGASPVFTAAASASARPSPSTVASPSAAASCSDCVVLSDPVLGIAFLAPRSYSYRPATTGNVVLPYLTTAARLSSYASSPPDPLMQELLIQMQLISTDQDLRTIANTRFQCDLSTLRDVIVAARQAVRWEGPCAEDAPRIRVLIAVGPGRVLVLNALPPDSTRLADLERLLASLAWTS